MMHKCHPGRCFEKDTPVHAQSCGKGFPFPVTPVTHFDEGISRVRYRRRGPEHGKVVPYNEYLLLKYDAHINVVSTNIAAASTPCHNRRPALLTPQEVVHQTA